jgi:hypothetical protein
MGQQLENTIFGLLPTGMNQHGYSVSRIEECVRRAGSSGLLQSGLTRAFQRIGERELDEGISLLTRSETIHTFKRQTAGRKATVYVHKDYADEHAVRFPDDRRV